MIDVLWLNYNPDAPPYGYWCYGWLEDFFQLKGAQEWRHHQFRHHTEVSSLEENTGAVVVIPAEYNAAHVGEINQTLAGLPWSVVILASDEAGLFPVEDLLPLNSLWVMTPHFEKHRYKPGTHFMGEFWPQHARNAIEHAQRHTHRQYRAGFSGQITHQRREELRDEMSKVQGVYFNGTEGFAQGLRFAEYYQVMVDSLTAPAPSGPVTLDSFRAFEALECGSIPVLDLNCPKTQNGTRYWDAVFGSGHPLPTVSHWSELQEVTERFTQPADTNRIFAWWQQYKRDIGRRILADVPGIDNGQVTVLVPTSPIASHPSLDIITETIETVQLQHPTADIIIMIDGIRPEQEDYRPRYEQYVRDLLWQCNFVWHNVTPMLFDTHQHQANMTRAALDHVLTPTILFVEHDTPLVTDRPFDWQEMIDLIGANIVDVIRLHYEGRVHPEHEYLMLDKIPVNLDGVWLRRTLQWSQRPHLAGADYYRRILARYFPPDNCTMIEDRMHGIAKTYPAENRLALYCPPDADGHIVRSYHLDGRKTDPKFEMDYGSVTE